MTSETDIANRALSAIGARSTITSMSENSNEAAQCALLYANCRDELLRLAPWNCATNYNNLALICSAPGTPENPTIGSATWQKGIPAPPWAYEYAYPSDCLRPLWVVPQFNTGFNASGIPLIPAYTGGFAGYWNGPPVKFKVSIDQITNGVPAVGGADARVILTNQQDAILCYIKRVTDPDVWDSQFQQALVATLGARLVIALTGDKGLANLKIGEANQFVTIARAGDGNEGLTINDVTPDWIRCRGIAYPTDGFSPGQSYDWGPMLSTF